MLRDFCQESEHGNENSDLKQEDRGSCHAKPAKTTLRKTFTSLLSRINIGNSATDSDSSDRQSGDFYSESRNFPSI